MTVLSIPYFRHGLIWGRVGMGGGTENVRRSCRAGHTVLLPLAVASIASVANELPIRVNSERPNELD